MDIVFVILHYLTYKDTKECIESIERCVGTKDYKIIVVDNASNNGSIEQLMDFYKENSKIQFVLNKKNLGFSNGLNKGIELAKNMKADFIAAVNNDTVILSDNFYPILKNKYEKTNFSVAGPMIITSDDKCSCNPMRDTIRSIKEAEAYIKVHETLCKLIKYHLFWMLKLKRILTRKKAVIQDKRAYLYDQINYQLHGAFWIFSREYFEHFDALDDRIFLYGEESLLFLHLMKNGMVSLYTPDLRIYHKEDSSTNALIRNSKEKTMFVSKNSIESLKTYISIYKEYERNQKFSGDKI